MMKTPPGMVRTLEWLAHRLPDTRSTREALTQDEFFNGKPYRSKTGKAMAKKHAIKCEDGAFRCPEVPVKYHG